mmetsp:Transcript_13578/g.28918  ORF Transcript_13578/g.28918 Transcript_13578/m.28918 type:complete len:202 (-) Transcript_13578:413-1018(-)
MQQRMLAVTMMAVIPLSRSSSGGGGSPSSSPLGIRGCSKLSSPASQSAASASSSASSASVGFWRFLQREGCGSRSRYVSTIMTWHCSEYTRMGMQDTSAKKSGLIPQLTFSNSSGCSSSRSRELRSTAIAVYPRAKNENELIPARELSRRTLAIGRVTKTAGRVITTHRWHQKLSVPMIGPKIGGSASPSRIRNEVQHPKE